MNLLKKLAIGGLVLLGISGGVRATPFFKSTDVGKDYVTLEGRLSFSDGMFKGFAKKGDELGIFRGPLCIGSSSFINEKQSHYFDLKIYDGAMNFILNGLYDVKAFKKSYNLETDSLWDVKVMGYDILGNRIDFQAFNPVYIPEASTIALLEAGVLALRKRKYL